MTALQALELANRVVNCWPVSAMSKETKAEYVRAFKNYEYKTVDQAIDVLVTRLKFVPTIAEIVDTAVKHEHHDRPYYKNGKFYDEDGEEIDEDSWNAILCGIEAREAFEAEQN